jgi:hypothetical protein
MLNTRGYLAMSRDHRFSYGVLRAKGAWARCRLRGGVRIRGAQGSLPALTAFSTTRRFFNFEHSVQGGAWSTRMGACSSPMLRPKITLGSLREFGTAVPLVSVNRATSVVSD